MLRRVTALLLILVSFGGIRVSCVAPEHYSANVSPAPTAVPIETPSITPVPTAAPTEGPTPEPTPIPTPTPEPVEASLMFVGDLMCLGPQQRQAQYAAGGSGYDFSPSFRFVKPVLESADCAFGNLETALSTSWPLTKDLPRLNDSPNCNGPKEYLEAVRWAGIDVLALANNHICDGGEAGVRETLDALDEYGLSYSGAFRSESEKRYLIVDVKGIRIGFLSYAESYYGKAGRVNDAAYMLNQFTEEKVTADIAAAKAEGAELIVVFVHWGHEFISDPPNEVRWEHARMFANAGADIIIGGHSHTVQPREWIETEDGRRVLCMYSLSNFISSMSREGCRDTFIAEIRLRREFGGSVEITEEIYHPCIIVTGAGGGYYVTVPTENTELTYLRGELDRAYERIMSILLSYS